MGERNANLPDLTAPLVDAVEGADIIDPIGSAVGAAVRQVIPEGVPDDVIGGAWFGHSLHPLLTDLVIGSFTYATVLDLIGGRRSEPAVERLIGLGIASYLPTALTGVRDYSEYEERDPRIRRAGVVHAASNSVALSLYAASLQSRRRGHIGRGRALSLLGSVALGLAGYLGGHLTYRRGVAVETDPAPSADGRD